MTVSTHYYGDGCPEHNRCQDWNTEPGVMYHAHDLPPCWDDGVRFVNGRWCCERHAQQREATERRAISVPSRGDTEVTNDDS